MAEFRIIRRIDELRRAVSALRASGQKLGLAPTMGALHEGHLSLVRMALSAGERAIATIFVNPRQFAASEDLERYPRDEAADAHMLRSLGADILFAPTVEEVYPAGFSTTINVDGLTRHLCGPFRPGHFAGVATIVAKLLLMAQPDRAYFGEKDFQQLQVIRRLVRDLDIPVEIVGAPIVREADGLAMSSRNRYLPHDGRAGAAMLPKALQEGASLLADGREAGPVLSEVREQLRSSGFDRIDYVELCDAETLEPISAAGIAPSRLFAAAWIAGTRLIDNWPVVA